MVNPFSNQPIIHQRLILIHIIINQAIIESLVHSINVKPSKSGLINVKPN